jgi:hypothetical protein
MSGPFDRAAFYASVRVPVFHGMTQAQVDGCEAILAEAERRALDSRFVAYILATAFWESGRKMQPVREIGEGRGKAYGVADPATGKVYYGRGLVQLTWKANYEKFAKLCGVDLVGDPDLALGLSVSVAILFEGMLGGLFTGRKLAAYFTAATTDWVGARTIINGEDQAQTIAAFAEQFEKALLPAMEERAAAAVSVASGKPATRPVVAKPGTPSPTWMGRLGTLIGINR